MLVKRCLHEIRSTSVLSYNIFNAADLLKLGKSSAAYIHHLCQHLLQDYKAAETSQVLRTSGSFVVCVAPYFIQYCTTEPLK